MEQINADDTSLGCKGKSRAQVIIKLEEAGNNILEFTASNRPMANASKTEFMFTSTTYIYCVDSIKI